MRDVVYLDQIEQAEALLKPQRIETLRQLAERPLPVAERAAGEVLSLPMFPHMTDRQVDYVCESLAEALRAAAVGSEAASA